MIAANTVQSPEFVSLMPGMFFWAAGFVLFMGFVVGPLLGKLEAWLEKFLDDEDGE